MTQTMRAVDVATGGTRSTTPQTVGVAGAGATIIFWLLGWFFPDFVATAPVGAEAAVTALIAWGAGMLWSRTHR